MARPIKYRKICHFPKNLSFKPTGNLNYEESVKLTLDEYETIRLIDREGKSQEECAVSMKVARTTVQKIYTSARRKISEAIIDGRVLEIVGGDYNLCNGRPEYCSKDDCNKKKIYESYGRIKECDMRIACPVRYNSKEEIYLTCFKKADKLQVFDLYKNDITANIPVDISGSDISLYDWLHILDVDAVIADREDEAFVRLSEAFDVRVFYVTDKEKNKELNSYLHNYLEILIKR